MSKRLEDFIRNNKVEFDDLEPREGLWDNIESKLFTEEQPVIELPKKRETKTFSLGYVLRVAAIVIMVMCISFVLYIKNQRANTVDYAAINPEFAKQRMQYASLVQTKRSELKTLTKSNPELYHEFSAEIAKMDSTYKKLNHDLATSPNQERVLRAMIRNLQIQTEVLNQQLNVIEQFNELKNQQQHETKSI
ncbi:hypothetical protein [Mucilaginibacter boryungensis]|uniref:Anti-sigma factor n=1 Tax=Mucilaginibacter boryungensis TaxID=768480 RepID=A0ABR9XM30_9SPHI|nr:hypothetical protein [Mucilaginibacter boryungensis]MBE9668300.1 hypothetical protein [Mucilaginibacter boryungensis]